MANQASTFEGSLKGWFENLQGAWSLERTMSNGATFSGRAVFLPHASDQVLVMEEGRIALADGTVLAASRSWLWQLGLPDSLIISYTGDRAGELYHHVALERIGENWCGNASHLCGNDTYQGVYRLSGDRMAIDQTITGPAKDLTVKARFFRY